MNIQWSKEKLYERGIEWTSELLQDPNINKFSFEETYRAMYLMSVREDSMSVSVMDKLKDMFEKGEWVYVTRWKIVKDVWLYPIHKYPEVKLFFDRIINTIDQYDDLLDEICRKRYPHVPKDIKFLIAQKWN